MKEQYDANVSRNHSFLYKIKFKSPPLQFGQNSTPFSNERTPA